MQRVANCVLIQNNRVLLLQKPKRGWWSAPGGKMEPGESIKECCIREFHEETGIQIEDPEVRGIFTFVMKDEDEVLSEWMMFTFVATKFNGTNVEESEEGKLEWHCIEDIEKLPMAEGDYHILEHTVFGKGMICGTFTYTDNRELLQYRFESC